MRLRPSSLPPSKTPGARLPLPALRRVRLPGPRRFRLPGPLTVPVAVLLALLAVACSEPRRPPDRIVLIVADTLRRDHLSPYGAAIATPHLARLAREGQVFTNAIASFHQTTMSMGSLFTGRTPSLESGDPGHSLPWTSEAWCGLARLASSPEDGCVPDALETLAEDLSAAGYETIGVVANRLLFRPYGYDQGFDAWIEVGERERPPDRQSRREEAQLRTGERVNERVLQALTERRSDRFFLYVHYVDPHDYGIRPELHGYADGVRHLDGAVGALLDRLRADGLLENAVVVFTSDHGEQLGAKHALPATPQHFGNPSFEPLLRVPLLVWPTTARDPDGLVRTQDLRGLIREIAGLAPEPPQDLQPDEVFLTEQAWQTYRRGRWKSTWSRDGRQAALFDLQADPGETRDVSAEHPEIVAAHRRRVVDLTRSLGTRRGENAKLSGEDAERLRALGYLEAPREQHTTDEPSRE